MLKFRWKRNDWKALVDGLLPVDIGLSPDKSESAASASAAGTAAALGAAQHRAAEHERQAKVPGPARSLDALALASTPDRDLARLGGDKRFDSAIMSRYTCASYDIFGPKPMYGFVSMAVKIAFPKYKLAFVFGLNNILLTRLFLAFAQFNPVTFLTNYIMSTGESLIPKEAMDALDFPGIQSTIGDFVKAGGLLRTRPRPRPTFNRRTESARLHEVLNSPSR